MDTWDFWAAIVATWIAGSVFFWGYRAHWLELRTGKEPRGMTIQTFAIAGVLGVMYFTLLDHPFWGDVTITAFGLFLSGSALYYVLTALLRWQQGRQPHQQQRPADE